MLVVSGFIVPKLNPISHDGNIRLLRSAAVIVKHQEDDQTDNDHTYAAEKPEEILDIMTEIDAIIFLVSILNSSALCLCNYINPCLFKILIYKTLYKNDVD